MDVVEASECPHSDDQIVTKSFHIIMESQVLPEVVLHEWRRKSLAGKVLSNFKKHFAREARDYRKNQGITVKYTCDVSSTSNQVLL